MITVVSQEKPWRVIYDPGGSQSVSKIYIHIYLILQKIERRSYDARNDIAKVNG